MSFIEGKDYQVYKHGKCIGTIIGDEFIRSLNNKLLYRIDDGDIYSLGNNSEYLGEMDGLTGIDCSGNVMFSLKLD